MSLSYGKEYIHRVWGRVLYIAPHPCDGATLIVERQSTIDRDDDDLVLDTCERCDLADVELQDQWPFLGFTSRERSEAVSQAWCAKHGFVQVSSGRHEHSDGRAVSPAEFSAAWDEDYLSTQKEVV